MQPTERACQHLGVGLTILKRLCRKFGLARWPYRKLSKAARLAGDVLPTGPAAVISPSAVAAAAAGGSLSPLALAGLPSASGTSHAAEGLGLESVRLLAPAPTTTSSGASQPGAPAGGSGSSGPDDSWGATARSVGTSPLAVPGSSAAVRPATPCDVDMSPQEEEEEEEEEEEQQPEAPVLCQPLPEMHSPSKLDVLLSVIDQAGTRGPQEAAAAHAGEPAARPPCLAQRIAAPPRTGRPHAAPCWVGGGAQQRGWEGGRVPSPRQSCGTVALIQPLVGCTA